MKIFEGSRAIANTVKASVVTLGVFDGVHLGHQQLIKTCVSRAAKLKVPSVIYTFDPHPVHLLFPQACPPLINTLPQKLELIAKYRVDICVVEKFTKAFSKMTPDHFFKRILIDRLQTKELIVGYDFTFGTKRRGTITTLSKLGMACGVRVEIIDAFLKEGHLVSSTVARKEIQEGEMRQAALLLGRPYFIDGTIVSGDGLGRQLGFPTANLESANGLLPAHGVYATKARLGRRRYNGLTHIGTRPTFCGRHLRIETHLLDFKRSIKGQQMRLEFLSRIRPEKHFSGPQELIAQIHKDIRQARRYFKELKS